MDAGRGEGAAVEAGLDAAIGRAFTGHTSMMLGLVLGFDSGLLQTLAQAGGTAQQVAARGQTDPRMTEEWLRAMVVAGFADHADGVFSPVEGLAEFVGDGGPASPVGAFVGMVNRETRLRPRLADAVRNGGGIPPSVYEPEGSVAQDVLGARFARRDLLPRVLGAVPGLLDRLGSGVDVLEFGCGGGEALIVLATAHPASRYVGYDLSTEALMRARAKVVQAGVGVHLEERDALEIPAVAFDIVIAVDTVHDLAQPLAVLRAVGAGLRPGGVFVMCEVDATGDFFYWPSGEPGSRFWADPDVVAEAIRVASS